METNDRLNPASPDTRQDSGKDSSERRCILSGESAPRTGLIRLALGPDGQVAADWSERLPGRGAWITADKALFDSVAAKGRLRGALARAQHRGVGQRQLAGFVGLRRDPCQHLAVDDQLVHDLRRRGGGR